MLISDLLTPQSIIPDLKATSKKQALQEIASYAAEQLQLEDRAILDVLLERERLGSTGVGGGVIVNGDVVSGVVGAGGEIGHMCLNPAEERTCGCGGHGHLEQYSSATGVVSNYLAECEKAGVEPIELTGPSDSKDVFQACREGDKLALAAADTMADYLGRALALIANVVDPEMFLIGGGASASADVYLDKVREHFKQYALSASRETPIKVASLGNDAGIIGAAYVALRAAGK